MDLMLLLKVADTAEAPAMRMAVVNFMMSVGFGKRNWRLRMSWVDKVRTRISQEFASWVVLLICDLSRHAVNESLLVYEYAEFERGIPTIQGGTSSP
jgi:hypothetical protein